jgi:hypothetical protein
MEDSELTDIAKRYSHIQGKCIVAVKSELKEKIDGTDILRDTRWDVGANGTTVGICLHVPKNLGYEIWGAKDPIYPLSLSTGSNNFQTDPDYFYMKDVDGFPLKAGDSCLFDMNSVVSLVNTKTQSLDRNDDFVERTSDGMLVYSITPKNILMSWRGDFSWEGAVMMPGHVSAKGIKIEHQERTGVYKDEEGNRSEVKIDCSKDSDHVFRVIKAGHLIGDESKDCGEGDVVITLADCNIPYCIGKERFYIFQENWIVAKADVDENGIKDVMPLGKWVLVTPIPGVANKILYTWETPIMKVDKVGEMVTSVSEGSLIIPYHAMQYRDSYDRDKDTYSRVPTGKMKRGGETYKFGGKMFIKEGVIMAQYGS